MYPVYFDRTRQGIYVHLYSFVCHLQVVSHGTIACIKVFPILEIFPWCTFVTVYEQHLKFFKLYTALDKLELSIVTLTKRGLLKWLKNNGRIRPGYMTKLYCRKMNAGSFSAKSRFCLGRFESASSERLFWGLFRA